MSKLRPVGTSTKGSGPVSKGTQNPISSAVLKQARGSGQLNLSGKGLVGDIPLEIYRLNSETPPEVKQSISFDSKENEKWWDQVDLTKLIMASNQITCISDEISLLPALNVLDLHDNKVSILSDKVAFLENLRVLNLGHNQLQELPAHLFSLPALQVLKVEHNALFSLPEMSVQSRLEELEISHNGITNLPKNIGLASQLRKLNAAHNSISSLPESLGLIRSLTEIELSHNKLHTCFERPNKMESLTRADFRHNLLTEVPLMLGANQLRELYLGNNKLTVVAVEVLSDSIKILDLGGNQIEHLSDKMDALAQLERLDLSNNNISTLPSSLGLIKGLKALVLDGNPMRSLRRDIIHKGTNAILLHLRNQIKDGEPSQSASNNQEKFEVGVSRIQPPAKNNPTSSTSTSSGSLLLEYCNKKVQQIPENVFSEFLSPASVTQVSLKGNQLTCLPPLLPLFSSIVSLDCSFNKLVVIQPFIASFVHLKVLDLRNNQLESLPSEVASMPCLEEAILALNRFAAIPPCLYSVKTLTTIILNDNKVESIDAHGLNLLSTLTCLDLTNNSICDVPPHLGLHQSLKSLKLEGNLFKTPRPQILAKGTPAILAYLKDRIT